MTASLRIEIFVRDIVETLSFYERLGFDVARATLGDRPRYAAVRLGGVRIGIVETDQDVTATLRHVPTGTEIVIEVDDVAASRDAVAAHGIPIAEDLTTRPWGLTDFRLHDPDGYYLRYTDRRG